jgi:hypothetical protein
MLELFLHLIFPYAIAGPPPAVKWPVHYTLEEVTISTSTNLGVQKAHGGKKKGLLLVGWP